MSEIALKSPSNKTKAISLTAEQFRYGFGNAISESESNELYERWGVKLTTIEDRERGQQHHIKRFEDMLTAAKMSSMPSGEMVAPVIQCRILDQPGWFPLNIPNEGQVADLPIAVTVESICVADGNGARGRDAVCLPAAMAEHLRRVSVSQELTVEAALTGDPDKVFEAMLADPLAGRMDYDRLADMADEMLRATSAWLPQFTRV